MVAGNSEEGIERHHQHAHPPGDYDARDFNDLKRDFENWKKIVSEHAQQIHGDGDREAMDESLQTRVREHEKFISNGKRIILWFGAALASLLVHAAWKIFSQK